MPGNHVLRVTSGHLPGRGVAVKRDVENALRRGTAFSNMGPVYIYVSHTRNDAVLRNYNFGAYRYWGDRITFKDSIEFKHFAPSTSLNR